MQKRVRLVRAFLLFLVVVPFGVWADPTSTPVVDTFDAGYSGWVVTQGTKNFKATTTDTFAGAGAVFTDQDTPARVAKMGTPLSEGATIIHWKDNVINSTRILFAVCEGGDFSTFCSGSGSLVVSSSTSNTAVNVYNTILIAWRNATTTKEFCYLFNSTTLTDCVWQASAKPITEQYGQVAFGGQNGVGPNEYLWVDDVGVFPQASSTATTTPTCTVECNSSVMFLPGIESSRLYRPDYNGGEDQLWEPNIDTDVQDLFLGLGGVNTRDDIYVKKGDVLDELPTGKNIYNSFIGSMDTLKSTGKIADWEPIAYDWRLSLDEVLQKGSEINGKIYYSGFHSATATPYIIQELRRLAGGSRTGKVTIVAHSNGGLVAKRLTQLLGSEASQLVDKMILVASPQAGTPVAVAIDMHGYDQEHALGIVTTKNTARTFASTSPMAYNLLPSADYFTHVDDPVVTFDASLPDWSSHYGSAIHSSASLQNFLTDSYGRVDAQMGDVDQPIKLNSTMFTDATAVHTNLDAWSPPQGVNLVQIAGWGVPTTVSGVTYLKKDGKVTYEANTTIDGDGTVVVPSALWTSAVGSTTNYYVDLQKYNRDSSFSSGFGFAPFDHSRILEANSVLKYISDSVTKNILPISNYSYLSNTPLVSEKPRLKYSLHSPLTLNLYDYQGRHTGVSTTTGQIEEQIPGTYYAEFGEVKYIFSDASTSAQVVMNGYAPGTFTFNVDQYTGNNLTASTTFKDIPTTASTTVGITIQSDITTLAPMQIDTNGDRRIDFTITPKLNDVVTLTKAPLSVTADNKTMILHGALPPLTATLSGFVNGDTATSSDVTGVPKCTTTATATSSVGVYPITCTIGTLASSKYSFVTFVAGTLTILYRCDGFGEPFNDHGHEVRHKDGDDDRDEPGNNPSVFKSGSTIPVSFALLDAGGVVQTATTSPLWYVPAKGGSMSKSIDESVFTDTSTVGAAYKQNGSQWRYNWSTKGTVGGNWHRVYTKLGNGQVCSVTVGLR